MNLGKKNLSSKNSRDILVELATNSTIQENDSKEMLRFLKTALSNEHFIIKKKGDTNNK